MVDSDMLGIPLLDTGGQSDAPGVHNLAVLHLDALHARKVLDRDLTAPPATPADGDTYIPAAGASGAWAGWDDYIVFAYNSKWYEITPVEGVETRIADENVRVMWDGTQWVALDGYQQLTDGANIAWDTGKGLNAHVTIADNRTFDAPTKLYAGACLTLQVIQDPTGSRLMTWNAVFKWKVSTAPVLSTAANAVDLFNFVSDGTNLLEKSRSLDVG